MAVSGWERVTREALIEGVEAGYVQLAGIVRRAGDRAFDPGACGQWSVREVLAHLVTSEHWLALQLGARLSPLPEPAVEVAADQDRFNAFFVAWTNGLPVEELLRQAGQVRAVLRERFAELTNAELDELWEEQGGRIRPYCGEGAGFTWPLWRWIVSRTLDHYCDHLPELERFLASVPTTA
jgi:hypothetical protein